MITLVIIQQRNNNSARIYILCMWIQKRVKDQNLGCHRKRQLQTGTFLEGSRLQVDKFVGLLFLWGHEAPIKMVLSMTGVSSGTDVQWYQYFRDICSWKLVNLPTTLGGPGKIVQIDESVMVKAKYHRGHQLRAKQRWVFGIYDPSTKEGHQGSKVTTCFSQGSLLLSTAGRPIISFTPTRC